MSDKKRNVEDTQPDDEIIGPFPVIEEQPVKKKQKGYLSNKDVHYLEIHQS